MKEVRDEQTNTKLRIEASSAGGGGPPSASAGPSKPAQPPETSLSRRIPLNTPVRLLKALWTIPSSFPEIKMAEEEVDIDLADPEVSLI